MRTYHNVEPTILALVVVASGAPMLPFASLPAGTLLPHALRMIETFRVLAVRFQCKVFLRLCVRMWRVDIETNYVRIVCVGNVSNNIRGVCTLTGIVVGEMALRAAHDDVLAAPRELLDVRTVVGQRHGAAVVALLAARHILDGVEILVFGRQRLLVSHQIAQRHRVAVVGALGVQRIALHFRAERMHRATSARAFRFGWDGGD